MRERIVRRAALEFKDGMFGERSKEMVCVCVLVSTLQLT